MNTKSFLNPNPFARAALLGALLCSPVVASATVLFSDDFNTNSSPRWTVNVAPTANASTQEAAFAFDYSAFGIPAAPGSTDTLGLRLRSNIPGGAASPVTTRPAGVTSGLSVSPTGQDFGTSYHLSFYAWVNFNGAANTNGLVDNGNSEGGTHNVLFAVGTSGTVPLVVGNTGLVVNGVMDGIGFATTGDGGITADYRVYPKSGTISATNSGVYAAGISADANNVPPTGNVNLYYQAIPSLAPHSAPAIQQTLSTAEFADAINTQAGKTQIGAFGFAWHRVDIYKVGAIVKWTIDNTAIATIDTTSLGALGGNNIALGDSDVNSTTTRHPSLLFTVIDNLVVSDVTAPALQASISGTNLNLSWPEASGSGFTLQSATTLASGGTVWNNVTNTVTATSGTLSTSVPVVNSATYFRLKLP
ncbi:MAG: hypothetical protein JWO95_3151 [Verrucomicrobiales bacterium]|nr:hypothetical protein [Verrucomicrobiales bacterium]